ncbi:FAD-dependent monooxygenase [Nocardia arthritidis]|uniref:FAD-dependent monooxygenase n=1 Tax=Nocardia arthritidis TaxID=228602 RepID=UPI001C3FC336|nr:FAD-dependent monooxygenase [Nocardia arthritidis]
MPGSVASSAAHVKSVSTNRAGAGDEMKIVCVGGGPAGLYFAISMKRRDPAHDITVIDRDPVGSTYGWGVVYWDDLLDILYRNDPDSARGVRAGSVLWREQAIHVRDDQTAHFGGYGFSMGRAALLDVLSRRASDLGVDVQHGQEVHDLSGFVDADLIVAADGANSRVRQLGDPRFGTSVTLGENRYIWLGTDKVFTRFTFAFEHTSAGWIWFHAYPSVAGKISTCIIECQPQTWHGLGFDSLDNSANLRVLENIFTRLLDGHSLISKTRGEFARWSRFPEITNKTWYHDNVVLLGDAAHTTHFTIGSGTRLAIVDAVVLAQSLYEHAEVADALENYEAQRRAALRPIQAAARTSMIWFEHADRYLDRSAVQFAYAMAARHGPQMPWRYQRHLLTQIPVVRKIRRGIDSGQRWWRAARRGELAMYQARRS